MTSRVPPFVPASGWALRALSAAGLALLSGPVLAQGSVTGPSKCVGCHDHSRQAEKWQREEPAQLKNKAHYNTRKALDAPEGLAYAKKLGLADTYDLEGPCVGCHSTVFRGDASAGVSCESCHGAASAYLEPHQAKGSYAKAVAAGMRDLKGKADAIARVCVACHVTTDKRLLAASHPSGAGFDAGVNLRKIVHFATPYDSAQMTAAGRAALGGRAGAVGVQPPAAPPPAPALRPVAQPASALAPPASAAAARATATARAAPAAPAAPAAEAAPWDWDQPIRPLPENYVPEPVPEVPALVEAAPPVPDPGPEPAVPVAPPPVAPLPMRPAEPPPPPPPPSIAEEIALPLPMPGAAAGGDAVSAAIAPAPVEPAPVPAGPGASGPAAFAAAAAPRLPAAEIAELRGRAGALLERLLRGGARVPDLPAPTRPSEFKGADSELLRIQDEVLALALEALRRPE